MVAFERCYDSYLYLSSTTACCDPANFEGMHSDEHRNNLERLSIDGISMTKAHKIPHAQMGWHDGWSLPINLTKIVELD